MRTPASIAGHPIHPMLVPIAIGGFVLSFAFDLVGLCFPAAPAGAHLWNQIAYYTMLGGIVGALAAAVPGLIDLLSLPAGTTRTIGITHMAINLTVVAMYVVNAWMRSGFPASLLIPMVLSGIAIGLLLVSGWLGGKMVFEAGVGVGGPS